VKATPNWITFRVRNPDGLESAPSTGPALPGPETPVGADAFWLTLHGSQFDFHDSYAFVGGVGGPLTMRYVSATELRALVPPGLLLRPGLMGFRVESGQDSDLVSETRFLKVFDKSGSLPPVRPTITAIEPRDLPYVPGLRWTPDSGRMPSARA